MNIVIDCRMYSESGIGRYIRNLISNLQILDKTNDFFLLLTKDSFYTLNFHNKNFHKVLADFRWYGVEEQIKLLGLLRSLKPSLVHFPHFNAPIFFKGKFVVTIHDLIHQHFQMRRTTTHDPVTYKIKQLGYKIIFKNAVRKSQEILVPSNYVKNLLVKEWMVSGKKIVVTHEAVDDLILSLREKGQGERGKVLEKFKIHPPYIFYVGNAHPHKNVEGLIRVFLILKRNYQHLQLVLSGSNHYFWQRIKKEFQHQDLVYTGQVSDEELVALYKDAQCFVLPSFEEGFGIPILEAMAIGCPVVCSKRGSLPEIGGDAAIYFDPEDRTDMTNKTNMVLRSEKLRKDLIKRGRKRVKLFSWQRLAEQTLETYLECV